MASFEDPLVEGAERDFSLSNQGREALTSDANPSTRVLGIIGPITDAPSEKALIQPPLAANDDQEGLVPVKRQNRRRKAWGADLRTNTTTSSICWDDYHAGREVWHQSWRRGLGLDCMVTIWPMDFAYLTPEERYETTKGYLRHFREFYRANDNLSEYACLYSREAKRDGTGEHIHLLLPTDGRIQVVKDYMERKFPGRREVKVEPSDERWRILPDGKLGNAATYLLKAACKSVRDCNPNTPFRLSGPVFGPRCGWSLNLHPTPARYRVPAPKRTKVRRGHPCDAQQDAA